MAGESISMTARRAGSGGRAAIARLKATPRFVRSMEERITMPSSSMSRIVSSLQEYQSTILRRFSVVTASRSTPSPRRSATTASGDWLETTTSPLPPDFRPSARNVSAKRSFSWPGGPWRTTLEPTGRPPWTIVSNPGIPVASRGVESFLQRTSQTAAQREVRMRTDRVPEGGLEDSFRRVRAEPLGAHAPEIPMDRRDEFPQTVQARLGPIEHLLEDGLAELLMVRRETMFHLNLDRRRADVPNPLKQGMEVGDVEVDHFPKRSGLLLEIHLESKVGGPQSIFERAGVVRPTIDEYEIREALQEFRGRRDVDVERPRDFAGKMPVAVAERAEDRDAVLAGEQKNCLSEGLLVHGGEPRNQTGFGGRSLFVVELGALKGCPGI